jgi:hypothetical protein
MKKGMKEMMEEMMSSGKPKQMDEKAIQAKKEMLMELLGLADSEIKGRSKSGLDEARAMKVSVMAKDKEGLKEGLEKAEEVLESQMPEEMEEGSEEESEEMEEKKEMPLMADSSMVEEEKPESEEDEEEEESFFAKKRK